MLCKEKVGACIQCSVKSCKTAYHVTCAFKHNLKMKPVEDEGDVDEIKLKVRLTIGRREGTGCHGRWRGAFDEHSL